MRVPTPTLERLATYLSILTDLKTRNIETISSIEVEERTGINAAQFRKDLSYFGEFGRPGIGYNVRNSVTDSAGFSSSKGLSQRCLSARATWVRLWWAIPR